MPLLKTEEGDFLHEVMDQYANDHDLWIDHFLDAWPRMQSNGYEEGELKDAPESSWLGYASLQGITKVALIQYIFAEKDIKIQRNTNHYLTFVNVFKL